MCSKLEMVREVIVGSVEREERLKALIYSAVYLKVSLILFFVALSGSSPLFIFVLVLFGILCSG